MIGSGFIFRCFKRILPAFFFLAALNCHAAAGSIRLVAWNLLNWPNTASMQSDSATRCPYYRQVINALQPSILITEENQDPVSTPWFLSQVLNVNSSYYRQGIYIQGPDSNNGIFYLDSLFNFVSNRPIKTTLRDINEFTMVYKPTQDTFRIYAVHLKASSGSANEIQRGKEVDSLRKVTNALPAGSNFIVCGDFNIYGDYESAYQKLLQDNPGDDGNFVDPFQMTGTWNDAVYSFYHSQSTRLNQFGGGSFGGLDDRFDLILYSNGVANSGGMYYVPGSCYPFGNDGGHYGVSINSGTNTAVTQAVADALYYASDHLPIVSEFEFGTNPGIVETAFAKDLTLFPNPVRKELSFSFNSISGGSFTWQLISSSGRVAAESDAPVAFVSGSNSGLISLPSSLPQGQYILLLKNDKSLIVKNILIFK